MASKKLTVAQTATLLALAQFRDEYGPDGYCRPAACRSFETLEVLRNRGLVDVQVLPTTDVARLTALGVEKVREIRG